MSGNADESRFRRESLVLYRHDPARVESLGRKKLTIVLRDGESLRVRPKDIDLLHPGPLESLEDLAPQEGEMKTAWEVLRGSKTTLPDLADLAYGDYTPPTAWAAWLWVADGLYFEGTPQDILARGAEEVADERARREARAAERRAWETFLDRARAGEYVPEEDERYLTEVEMLALGQTGHSRVLSALGRGETAENAHALLLQLGYWNYTVVPYPNRLGLATSPPAASTPSLPEEDRVDLTHLLAFAIDDEGTTDPDDAISLEADGVRRRVWVHVADVAALIPPDSQAGLEARARGATLYLPDGKVPMLPPEVADRLGMGLSEVSPALSFGIDVDGGGYISGMDVVPSWVRVTRLTYAEAETRLDDAPLDDLSRLARDFEARRRENGAIHLQFPEVRVRVVDGTVTIRRLPALRSRALVREAMLLAGAATASFAAEEGIPLPYAAQDPPDTEERPQDLAGMFELRRHMSRSEYSSKPGRHAGLGLERYVQATSPLRRYLDLVVHQQLRAYVRGEDVLGGQELMVRIGSAQAVAGSVSYAERLAREHWTLVYLLQNPHWRGEGVLVETWDRRGKVLIPELGLEPAVHLRGDWSLNDTVALDVVDVDLPTLRATFRTA
ncbi:MAG: RNB domain-containing ribonuclease [Anaerolineae bacterium]|jgi:exoribonuclease-2